MTQDANLIEEAAKFESILDDLIIKEPITNDCFYKSIHPPPGMTEEHFEILKPAYIKAGWKNVAWIALSVCSNEDNQIPVINFQYYNI